MTLRSVPAHTQPHCNIFLFSPDNLTLPLPPPRHPDRGIYLSVIPVAPLHVTYDTTRCRTHVPSPLVTGAMTYVVISFLL
ncbi:hypothetical protein FKM82_030627 [Ascaphus truei]